MPGIEYKVIEAKNLEALRQEVIRKARKDGR